MEFLRRRGVILVVAAALLAAFYYSSVFISRTHIVDIVIIGLVVLVLGLIRLMRYNAMSREMKFVFNSFALYTIGALTIFFIVALFFGTLAGLIVGALFLVFEAIPLLALYYVARGQYDQALNYVNQVMRFFPRPVRLYGIRGLVRSYQKDDVGAVEDYSQAISTLKARKSSRTRMALARYTAGRLESLLKLRDFEHALADADAVIRMQPGGTYGYAQRAVALLHMGEYADAFKDVVYALKINTEPTWNGTLYNTRGTVEYARNALDAALADFDRALAVPVSPDMVKILHPIVCSNQGSIHFMQHDYPAALASFTKAQSIDPNSLNARAGLAVTRSILGEKSAALQAWRALVEQDAGFLDAAWVKERYYKWCPPMVDEAQGIIAAVQAV